MCPWLMTKKCEIVSIGTMCLKFENDFVLNMKDVRYVPELCYNLMSCTALDNASMGKMGGRVHENLQRFITSI